MPFARRISRASSGEELGRIVQATTKTNNGAYASVRAAVGQRVRELVGAGEAEGLFMLAADLATTEALVGDDLEDGQRVELRALWVDLLGQA